MNRPTSVLWRRDPRPGALVIAFGIALLVFMGFVASILLYKPFLAFDQRVSAAIRGIDSPVVDGFFRAFTHVGDGFVVLGLTFVIALVLYIKERPAQSVLVVATVGGGALLGDLVRVLVERARPGLEVARIPLPESYSLPSGHALMTFLLAGMVFFIVALEARQASTRFWVLGACVLVAGLVALSRV
ncbi:MAG: phosphatase PAP2 family protein [Actinomycetota bacterium]|nr:phosphatase PAP2 family protein [Actinomycetota bacterium]